MQKQDISTAPCRSQSSTQDSPLQIPLSLLPADGLGAGVAKGGCLGRGMRIHDELAGEAGMSTLTQGKSFRVQDEAKGRGAVGGEKGWGRSLLFSHPMPHKC